jgi:hypothetical protein
MMIGVKAESGRHQRQRLRARRMKDQGSQEPTPVPTTLLAESTPRIRLLAVAWSRFLSRFLWRRVYI